VGVAADGSLYFLRDFEGTNCKLARYTLAQARCWYLIRGKEHNVLRVTRVLAPPLDRRAWPV
jgi:hypothetical protein